LDVLNVGIEESDLIIDLKVLTESMPKPSSWLELLPKIWNWRTITMLSGSFPIDLSNLKANNTYILLRNDWRYWRNEILESNQHSEVRLPSFGDYTIQHAIYKEPPSFPHVSASIRYTAEDSWIIFRGEWIGKKDGSGSAQYPAEAQLFLEKPEYYGDTFSDGDKFIATKAKNGIKPGNPKQWLQSGINHHITLTTKMVQSEILSLKKAVIEIPVNEIMDRANMSSSN
jgi:Beta protein